ncbi:MAG: hypothetical protein KC492_32590 [Myxococcales bacterium]|nr:hypothetical protein [Myxococcales bacterium]
MREQLTFLLELQKIDEKLEDSEQERADLPEKLRAIKEDVGRIERILEQERQQLAEARSYKAAREAEIAEDQELLAKAKHKMSAVRSSKEYLAVQREFEANRRHTSEREDEIGKLVEAIRQFEQSIKTHEEALAAMKSDVAAEEQATARRIEEIEGAVSAERGEREELAGRLRRDVLSKYNNIRRRRKGVAVVPLGEGGVCRGCNMRLPPQLYNIIQRAATIEQCPNCHRIVYFEAAEDLGEATEATD